MTDLAVVQDDVFEEYPIPLGDPSHLKFILYDHHRFLNSVTCCGGDIELIGVIHILQMRAVGQVPAGTLPLDETEQASLAGLAHNLERWRALVRRGAIKGWHRVLCVSPDREVSEWRLAHPAVYAAIKKGIKVVATNSDSSDRARLSRLRDKLLDLGLGKRFVNNPQAVDWVDALLVERGERRTRERVKEAAEFVSMRMAETRDCGDNSTH